MTKGYWIARLQVKDEAAYDEYRKRNLPAFSKYGAKFAVRGGPFERVMGEVRQHNVVIEFPSHEAALACYHSPEYQYALPCLKMGCEGDFIIIAGYEGPQPSQ
jgi:uncharacterized protein (DUF1330 family)